MNSNSEIWKPQRKKKKKKRGKYEASTIFVWMVFDHDYRAILYPHINEVSKVPY